MSESSDPSPESREGDRDDPRRGRKPWQVGLPTLFLLTAAIAVWTTFFINRRECVRLETRIAAMRPLARDLIVEDPAKITIVKLEELWYDENQWDIDVPSGDFRLSLSTRGIDQDGPAPTAKNVTIGAGRHRLVMEQKQDQDGWRIALLGDGEKLIEIRESKDWYPGSGSVGGGLYSVSTQLPADRPSDLFRRRFSRLDSQGRFSGPTGPTEGLLLRIEPTRPTKP